MNSSLNCNKWVLLIKIQYHESLVFQSIVVEKGKDFKPISDVFQVYVPIHIDHVYFEHVWKECPTFISHMYSFEPRNLHSSINMSNIRILKSTFCYLFFNNLFSKFWRFSIP